MAVDLQEMAPIEGVTVLQGDITSADGARSLLEQLEAHNAVIDILVNNYGTTDRHNWRDKIGCCIE